MNIVKNQHFVPQLYLKNFSNNGKINVFDKVKSEIRNNQPVRNVASSRFFYDIDIEKIYSLLNENPLGQFKGLREGFEQACKGQFLEKLFSEEIEPELKFCLNQILGYHTLLTNKGIKMSNSLNEELKFKLSVLLAIQHIRTKEFRVRMVEQIPQLQLEIAKKIEEKSGNDTSKFDGVIAKYQDDSFINIFHASYLLNEEFIMDLAKVMHKNIWYIGINDTENSLYTSDNPIIKIEHIYDGVMSHSGFASKGVEIVYPVSDRLALIIKERTFHKDYEKYDMKYKKLTEEEVRLYNEHQVFDSYRNVFSKNDDLDFAKDILEKNPILKDIDRMKIILN